MAVRMRGDIMSTIKSFDPELWLAMQSEMLRQRDKLELIASENYTTQAVL